MVISNIFIKCWIVVLTPPRRITSQYTGWDVLINQLSGHVIFMYVPECTNNPNKKAMVLGYSAETSAR